MVHETGGLPDPVVVSELCTDIGGVEGFGVKVLVDVRLVARDTADLPAFRLE